MSAINGTQAHNELLEIRREAQAKYPIGHPERVAAERAVGQSRIARRSSKQWALRALRVAQKRASQKTDPQDAVVTLNRGINTAVQWLDGTHPKAK